MRFDLALTPLSLFLCNVAAVHARSTSATNHDNNRRHLKKSDGLGLIRNFGLVVSDLLPSRLVPERQGPIKPRRAVKRAEVNARNQCVLSRVNNLIPNSSTSPANATSTVSQGRSSTTRTSTKGTKSSTTAPAPSSTSSSTYKSVFESSGSNFFDNWSFFTGSDPTHGNVQFVTQQQAQSSNLVEIDSNGYAIMRVDTTPQVSSGYRNSVRIESLTTFTGGLWIMDAVHMPSGCGTWPAFWSHGPNWPAGGEIDIVEGVNMNTYNQGSLHTSAGCTLPTNFGGTGTMVDGSNCASSDASNQGCGIMDGNPNSYGTGFNANGGGVYAMLWDDTGISVWFFGRNAIPADITAQAPQPGNWGKPSSLWPASTCPPFTYNQDHTTIFDTTLCGDWAGNSWNAAPNGGGQSCAQSTGVATCAQYVANNGGGFSEAYWQVKSVMIYQTSS